MSDARMLSREVVFCALGCGGMISVTDAVETAWHEACEQRLCNPSMPPYDHQVWAWVNEPGPGHWEARGTFRISDVTLYRCGWEGQTGRCDTTARPGKKTCERHRRYENNPDTVDYSRPRPSPLKRLSRAT